MKNKISILGSTGSIGLSALNILDKKRNFFNIDLLSAKSNYK
jgi:1-deoxy-D-xylulose 5-phosphate reductoisomerase